jgi:hypothetical protein
MRKEKVELKCVIKQELKVGGRKLEIEVNEDKALALEVKKVQKLEKRNKLSNYYCVIFVLILSNHLLLNII